ncbi:MAG: hypothetical protein U5K99_07545 [Anaerolineales bacterium]|nr:hypothetical protein [Anaerolineales bacterium]
MYFNFQLHYQVLQEQVKDRMLQNQTREKILRNSTTSHQQLDSLLGYLARFQRSIRYNHRFLYG